MKYTTLLRKKEHQELSKINFIGNILDLGGSRKSDYFKIISKNASKITVINKNKESEPDIIANIEEPLDLPNELFDVVVAMNLIEHVFNYQDVLNEVFRVLKNKGKIIVTVPFLFTIHPSPEDYFRYTKSSLTKMFLLAKFSNITVKELGCGVMVARYQLLQNFLPSFVRPFFEKLAIIEDFLLIRLSSFLGRKYKPENFPLGYIVIAYKL